jgi:thiol-disulfide isomerase/thioredoxin
MRRPRVRLTEWRGLLAVTLGLISLVAGTTAGANAGPPPDVKGADIADIINTLKSVETMVNALSVRATFKGVTSAPSHPDIPVRLTNVETSTVDRTGRARCEVDGQSFKIVEGKAVVRPSKRISTYDGVLCRSVSGVTTLLAGDIIKSPGGLGWSLNPFEMKTLFHAKPVSQIIGERNGKFVARTPHDGHSVLVVETEPVTRNGLDWNYRFLIDPTLNFAVVRRSQLIRFPPHKSWIEFDVIDSHDHREVAAGVWLPSRVQIRATGPTEQDARTGSMPRLAWEWDVRNENWVANPKVADSLFVLQFPPGTVVEDQVRGRVDKIPSPADQPSRRSLDALIGKPAPEFPEGAAWLNSNPLTWNSLRGKVVILDFWAEWCGPCRNDLPRLSRLHEARGSNGLTIVGIHPPGSKPEAIGKVMDEFHLGYPVCVDVHDGEEARGGGQLNRRFAVDLIPHAVAVDGRGIVIASGQLEHVLAKASALVKPRQ